MTAVSFRRRARAGSVAGVLVAIGGLVAGSCGDGPEGGEAPVSYVGRDACVECHATEAERWAGSHHDLAMQVATPETVLGDFEDATSTYGGVTSTFYRHGDAFLIRTDGPDGELREVRVAYTFGATPLQQYLVPLDRGRYQVLGIAWDTRPDSAGGQRWFHLYPDANVDVASPLHWTRPAQNWNTGCAGCHSTGVDRGFDVATLSYHTTWSEIDVSCEACHGPGSRHVLAAREGGRPQRSRKGGLWGLTVDLADPDRRWVLAPGATTATNASPSASHVEVETCAACHARRARLGSYLPGTALLDAWRVSLLREGLYHADGQIDDEVYTYGSFVQSRMYAAGVTCSDCHDPHSLRLRAEGNALCTRCHVAERYDTPSHHFHQPSSDGAQCVACHMPPKTYMEVDPRRDHSLRVPRPDLSRDLGTPNACNRCHADRKADWAAATVERWYGPRERPPDPAVAILGGRAADPAAFAPLVGLAGDTSRPSILRATALSLLGGYVRVGAAAALAAGLEDRDPLVRMGALEGLGSLPAATVLRLAYGLLDDPRRAIRIDAARRLASVPRELTTPEQADAITRGVGEYEQVRRANADEAGSWVDLGDLYAARGRVGDAEAAYRTALAIDTTNVAAYVNLADLQRRLGRDDVGEEVLKEARAVLPDAPEIHHAVGLLRVRQGDLAGALPWLERAATDSGEARFAYVYGVALASNGTVERGVRVLEHALRAHPHDRDLLTALATYSEELGRIDEALRYAEHLALVDSPGTASR